jgi:hypothetical protein
MKIAFYLISSFFVLFSFNLEATETFKITCYSAEFDRDNDKYAEDGTTGEEFDVPSNRRYTCPTGYVPDAGDCDDNRSSVHPYRYEIAFNNRDDNCNGSVDETEYIYWEKGNANADTSFKVRVKVNNKIVEKYAYSGYQIYAKFRYRPLKHTQERNKETGYRRVFYQKYTHSGLGEYKGFDFRLSNLLKTNVYRAQASIYVKDGVSYKKLVGYDNRQIYHTTTTDSSNKVSRARTKILLQGFKQYFNQLRGRVGRNGSVWPNGTHYGADRNEWWCSEFYAWTSSYALKNIKNKSSVNQLKDYFRQGDHYHRIHSMGDMDVARRADWIAMDTDLDGKKNHTAMFLARRSDGKIVTLEGNTGNRVKVRYRDLDQIYGVGHITSGKVKSGI